jgi:tetratricopeptide (TPR) repeat protein
MIEMDRGNSMLSREYYKKSILFSEKSNSKTHLSHAYNNKAILHFNLGETDSSLIYFEKSLRLRRKLNHVRGVVESYYNIGSYYLELSDYNNAYQNFSISEKMARENQFKVDEKDALEELLGICQVLNYEEEKKRIQNRLDQLTKFISEQKTVDKEIIEYAESVIVNANVKDVEAPAEDNSQSYIWIMSGAVLILLLGIFVRRKKPRR